MGCAILQTCTTLIIFIYPIRSMAYLIQANVGNVCKSDVRIYFLHVVQGCMKQESSFRQNLFWNKKWWFLERIKVLCKSLYSNCVIRIRIFKHTSFVSSSGYHFFPSFDAFRSIQCANDLYKLRQSRPLSLHLYNTLVCYLKHFISFQNIIFVMEEIVGLREYMFISKYHCNWIRYVWFSNMCRKLWLIYLLIFNFLPIGLLSK